MTSEYERVAIREGVSAREFDGEWIVLDLAGGNYYGLDALGGDIWEKLRTGGSAEEIADVLVSKYDVPKATIVRDIVIFIDELKRRELVWTEQP